jgi:hypothetical protein
LAMSCNPRRMMAASRACAALLAEEVVMTAEAEGGPVPAGAAHSVHPPVALRRGAPQGDAAPCGNKQIGAAQVQQLTVDVGGCLIRHYPEP